MSATDWLKMRSDIARDPKICRMVEYLTGSVDGDALRDALRDASPSVTEALRVTPCHILRHAIVGSLVTIWGTLRHRGDRRGDDLVVNEAGCRTVDAVGEFDGIGYAMSRVGWLIVEGTSVVLPRFFVHFNDDPSQHKRKLANDRQRRYRESKKGDTRVTSPLRHGLRNEVTENRNENENENENINPSVSPQGETPGTPKQEPSKPKPDPEPEVPIPAEIDTPAFRDAWERWHKFRRKNNWRKLIAETRIRQLKVLAEIGEQAAIATIEHSMTNGYQGLQPERFRGRPQAPTQAKLSFSPSRVHDRDPEWFGERTDDASQAGDAEKPDAELPSRLAEVREQNQQDAV